MMERILLITWGVWLLLILVAVFRVFGFNPARRRQDRRWRKGTLPQRPVAVIIPVKGFDLQATPRFFDSIFAQNYSTYRVIVTFESWDDPVAVWLGEHLEIGPREPVWTHPETSSGLRSITLVCGGLASDEGQKVHNQLAAFHELTGDDAIIAFADADIVCGPDWLARLVAPINQGTHPLATTYRWLVPKRPTLPNQLASVINASITTQGGSEFLTVLWGGSMAISRPVFDSLEVPTLFAGSLNDDLRLSKAARKAGNRIAFVRSLIIPTMVDFTWGEFFEFVKRQYTQVKFFSPILYTGINLVLGFYVLGALSIVAALVYGYFYAWIPVAAAYIIDQFRALARQQVYLSIFPENGVRQKLFAAGWLEHMLTPFWIGLHWLLLASTWTQNKVTWAGIRYRIRAVNRTQILSRSGEVAKLPAGTPGLAMLGALHDLKRGTYTPPLAPVPPAIDEALTYTLAEEETSEVVLTATAEAVVVLPEPTTAPLTVVTPEALETTEAPETPEAPASTEAAAERVPLHHPGGPSAVIPLTTTFYDRSLRYKEKAKASDRGAFSAKEVALTKTRILTSPRFPVRIASSTDSPSPVEKRSDDPGAFTGVSAVLSRAELVLIKTRLEGAVQPSKLHAGPSPDGIIRSRARAILEKTRIRSSALFPAPVDLPGAPSAHSCLPAPAALPLSGSVISGSHPAPKTRSLAARRAHGGGAGALRVGRASPALSARASQASRAAEGRPPARPGNRRPSGRH